MKENGKGQKQGNRVKVRERKIGIWNRSLWDLHLIGSDAYANAMRILYFMGYGKRKCSQLRSIITWRKNSSRSTEVHRWWSFQSLAGWLMSAQCTISASTDVLSTLQQRQQHSVWNNTHRPLLQHSTLPAQFVLLNKLKYTKCCSYKNRSKMNYPTIPREAQRESWANRAALLNSRHSLRKIRVHSVELRVQSSGGISVI